ncbi:hypothetical protein AABB24_029422 [Solanum stoloniferum]|uniref:Uncharacterized protein n=1 Tax=Solanum stoloniferum TaxID=62892 RepID=A0ABD2RZX6_9SOLN
MYPPSSSSISLMLLVLMIIIVVPLHCVQFSMAIRIFPTNPVALSETNFTSTKINQTEIFQKYFHDIIVNNNNNNNNNGTRNGTALLHDNKRRVPSCPDPLHNK